MNTHLPSLRAVKPTKSYAYRNLDGLLRIRRRSRYLSSLFLVLISLNGVSASASWQRQRSPSLAWLHAVYFVDQSRGWAVGSRGALLSTTDSGKTWQSVARPTEDVIRDIHFTDAHNGWLVCERSVYELKSNSEPRSYLMKTVDGGETWKRVSIHGADSRMLVRAVFHDGRGWAFGEGGVVFTTRDAGATWSKQTVPTSYLLLGGTFIDENSGWLVGAGSTILQTTDGGESWQRGRLTSPANIRFKATSFVDQRVGWAVGSRGAIYRTTNAGLSWQPQTSGVSADLLDVKFLDANEGWAVGAEGTLLHTTSGGLRWTSERSGTTHALERIFFADRTHGWAVGFGGTIIAYGGVGTALAPRLQAR